MKQIKEILRKQDYKITGMISLISQTNLHPRTIIMCCPYNCAFVIHEDNAKPIGNSLPPEIKCNFLCRFSTLSCLMQE